MGDAVLKRTAEAGALPLAQALEQLRRGSWETAHAIVQQLDDPVAWRIHALVHRIEGDPGNARYWYRKCRMKPGDAEIETKAEIEAIAALLPHPRPAS